MIDWDHAHRLLNIANLARQWPNLKWLHDAAMEELAKGDPNAPREIKTTPVEVPDPPAEHVEDESIANQSGAAEGELKRRPINE